VGEGNVRALIKHQRLLLPPYIYIYIPKPEVQPKWANFFLAKHFLGLAQLVVQTTYRTNNRD
jgi:hypothetical protein